ncbi:MAG: UbiX family flavin prenyltransferase [Treponema sp.]|nr:UbiX family flavin prenyltransferase [Treponema sp.]
MRKYLVCVTGASGAVYGIRVLRALAESGCEVHAIISRWGERVMVEETSRPFAAWVDTLGIARERVYDAEDLSAPPASGSFPLDGAVIVPCSMNSIGAMASGICGNLIHRAGLVCLKENHPLVLVPRECPFSLIDLKNMTTLALAGAVILSASPAFYHKPKTVDDLIDFIAGKILDRLGIEHGLFKRWE